MKLQIEIDDFFDEEGGVLPDVRETILKRVIDEIYNKVSVDAENTLKKFVSKTLTDTIKTKVTEILDKEIPNLLEYEFEEVTSWGDSKGKHRVKDKILNEIKANSIYKPTGYSSDQNSFTKLVNRLFDEIAKDVKADMKKIIDAKFTKEMVALAEKNIQQRLGIQ